MTQGIRFIRELRASRPKKPFFLYVANNAMHSPLHAKDSDMARYRGRYDAGWTAARATRYRWQIEMGLIPPETTLPPSDPRAPDWEHTDPQYRAMYARHMEAYAAMLDNADQNVGKLMRCLADLGELNNTLIVFTSDNGGTDAGGVHGAFNLNRSYAGLPSRSAAEERESAHALGGPRSSPLYPTAWGEVSNTPFPSFKTYTGAGGRRVSMIVSWPGRIADRGAIRRQFMHVTDVMPTILSLAAVPLLARHNGATTRAIDGVDRAKVLTEDAPSPRTEQYYECWSNRAYFRDGWLARSLQVRGQPIDMDNWTLHNLDDDFSEATDLAQQAPAKLAELVDAFDAAAWKKVSNRAFRIRTRFDQGRDDQGILWSLGDIIAGIVSYVEAGRLHVHYNGFGARVDFPPVDLPMGRHEAVVEYEALGARRGRGRLLLDDAERVAWMDLSPTLMFGPFEGFDVGLDRRAPVHWDVYERHGTFPYPGVIEHVWIEPGAPAPD